LAVGSSSNGWLSSGLLARWRHVIDLLSGLIVFLGPSAWLTRITAGWHPGQTRYESEKVAHPTTPAPLSSAGRAAQRESWGW
jgi:hypothetical protein